MSKKILIAYYSWSKNAEQIAKQIQTKTGGDLFMIEPETAYSKDYNDCVNEAKRQIQAGERPAIKALPQDIASYDAVLIGSPNWWSTIAPPVATFLEQCDLTGKTAGLFITHGGGGLARCRQDAEALCPAIGATETFASQGSSTQAAVDAWLKNIGMA